MEPIDPEAQQATLIRQMTALGERVRDVALTQPEVGPWFAMWTPVFKAVVRLGGTLFGLIGRLQAAAWGATVEPIDDDLKAELREELRDIADEFPDVADVLFGLRHLDSLWAALAGDDDARTSATALLQTLGSLGDRFLSTLVDIAVGDRTTSIGPDRVVEFLERYEGVVQQLIDRWLIPALGLKTPEDSHDADS